MKAKFIQFFRDEEGASAIEYALIAALIAIVIVTSVTDVGKAVDAIFLKIKTALTPA